MKYYQVFGRETCPWCCKACEILKKESLNFMFCEMEHSPELMQFYKDKYNMKTVPIIVERIDDEGHKIVIGGCTDLIDYLEAKNEECNEG